MRLLEHIKIKYLFIDMTFLPFKKIYSETKLYCFRVSNISADIFVADIFETQKQYNFVSLYIFLKGGKVISINKYLIFTSIMIIQQALNLINFWSIINKHETKCHRLLHIWIWSSLWICIWIISTAPWYLWPVYRRTNFRISQQLF